MLSTTKDDFAARLNQACDSAHPPIPHGRGRRAELRRRVARHQLVVSGESVRKWLSGESIPSMDNLRHVAVALSCDADWLLTGRNPPTGDGSRHHCAEPPAAYRPDHLSTEALELAEYYDHLPAAIRSELRAGIVKALIELHVKYPQTEIGDIASRLLAVR